MRNALATTLLAAVILVAGCTAPTTPVAGSTVTPPSTTAPASDVLAAVGLAGLNGRQIVEKLDQDPAPRPLSFKASVRADRVIIGNEKSEVSVPITGEKPFYLSIAPYAKTTHPCHFHSLATCRGEMSGKPVTVLIRDDKGLVLVDQMVTTYANGFVGFWLPRDIKGTVTVTAEGRTGTVPFATGPEDATCLTTLQVV
ncbi:MAG TPA: CueP family metal-binding protein [Propionibacteriaceae bacterium]|nr:CueP family metal-binding protein [Propionibacteriaceae bacterium]HPZ50699.1 CueP family metal-binding protein [Propionibacteriaceae bacterium]HQE31778.1 CueP family metal-binding protein [Propionibacteriaceae bacterium]